MTMLAIQTPNTHRNKNDRSYIAQSSARPLRPPASEYGGERPTWLKVQTEKTWPETDWLAGVSDPAVFDGLDRPWWQLLPASLRTIIATWRERAQARRDLAQIDARSLREAGIDPGVADFEAAQPFWRKPMTLRDLPADQI